MMDTKKRKQQVINILRQLRKSIADKGMSSIAHKKNGIISLTSDMYQAIFETSTDALLLVGMEGEILDCNEAVSNFYGYTKEELLKLNISSLLPDLIGEDIHDILNEKLSPTGHLIWLATKRKDGEVIPAEGNIQIIKLGDKKVILASVRSVTSLKGTQPILREGQITWRFRDGDFVILGYSTSIKDIEFIIAHDYVGKTANDIFQTKPDIIDNLRECLDRKEAFRRNHSYQLASTGDYKHLAVTYIPVQSNIIITHLEDITEQTEAERALHESERRLSTLINNLPGMAYRGVKGEGWSVDYISGGCFELTGYEASDLYKNRGFLLRNIVHHDDYESVRNKRQKALREKQSYIFEYRIVTASGEEKWVMERGKGIYANNGDLAALEGLITDIDDRKKAETFLQEEKDLIQNFLEMTGTIIIVINHDQRVAMINKKGCNVLGCERGDIIGKNWFDTYIAESESDDARSLFLDMMSGTRILPEYIERTIITHDGKEKIIAWHSSLIENAAFNLSGLLMSGEDITAQKRAEQGLRKSANDLRELSSKLIQAEENVRKRISRELHDSIGQYLTTIKVSAENSLHRIKSDKEVSCEDSLRQQVPLVQGAIEEVRKISRDLRPAMLDDLGIVATISWFCREFHNTFPRIRVEKKVEVAEKDIPDDLKIVIYRILQEACNNTAKYSEASKIDVSLDKTEKRIDLIIEDNGKGFDLQKVLSTESPRRGLGLESMKERTQFSQGSFEVTSTIGKGTRIHSSWPCLPIC